MHMRACWHGPCTMPLPSAGITPRVIRHIFSIVEGLNKRSKLGDKVEVSVPLLFHHHRIGKAPMTL